MNVLMAMLMAAQVSGLAGVWKKDSARSDDPEQKMQAVFQQMRSEGGRGGMHGGGGGMHGGGFGGGMHRGRRPNGAREGGRGPMAMLNAPDELTLVEEETELRIEGGATARVYTLDGEKHESEAPNGGKVETTARREGNAVSIEQKTSRGEIDQKLETSPDRDVLILTSTVELGSMKEPVVIKSVYVRAQKES